jgi:hypothetical protein
MSKQLKPFSEPTDEEIALYAYHLWESEGCTNGRDIEHWLQAKAQLTAIRQHEAGLLGAIQEAPRKPVAQKIPQTSGDPSLAPVRSGRKKSTRSASRASRQEAVFA